MPFARASLFVALSSGVDLELGKVGEDFAHGRPRDGKRLDDLIFE